MKVKQYQNTKIVATVGPACSSYEKLLELVDVGVDVFRINMSHGEHDEHAKIFEYVKRINKKNNIYIGILADLQGPKIRVGEIENGYIEIKNGDILTFVDEECVGTKDRIYMSYDNFAQDVKAGEQVLVDDGKIVLKVISTDLMGTVKLEVIFGGKLSSNKGVNLPDTKISLPCLTKKDMADLDFILQYPVNWIGLSFVRKAQDIKDLKKIIEKSGHLAKVIAKIEKPEAVDHIDSIIKVANGIMVARGDLGVEMPIEKLPAIQKLIITKCIQRARPVIVATQMMESMIENPSPSRAEVTDVANAVLDGADALMLSGETSVGKHPPLVVMAMSKIIAETEKGFEIIAKRPKPSHKTRTFLSDVVCFNAAKTAEEVGARAIVGMTVSGYTAFKISSYRPRCYIFIFSDRPEMLATLNLVWGVRCFYYDKFTTTDETITDVTDILLHERFIKKGQIIVNTASMPLFKKLRTNMLKVTVVE
jgi:pyruvate kinase